LLVPGSELPGHTADFGEETSTKTAEAVKNTAKINAQIPSFSMWTPDVELH